MGGILVTDFKYELQVKNGEDWKPQARAGHDFLLIAALKILEFSKDDEGFLFKIIEVEN